MRRILRSFPVQLRSDLKVFVRSPAALFFTAILPVIFLIMFVSIFGNERAGEEYGNVRISTLQVPAFIALAVVSASFVSLAIGLTHVRENGVLKRVRGTPAPPGIVFAGRIGTAVVSALAVTTILCAIGALAFGVTLPSETLPGLLVTLLVGAGSFCALGIAYTRLIPSDDAAPAMTNAVVLPLYFISGVFVPVSQASRRSAQRRRRAAGQAVRRRADDGVRPPHDRAGLRGRPPAGAGGLGRRRTAAGAALLRLDSTPAGGLTSGQTLLLTVGRHAWYRRLRGGAVRLFSCGLRAPGRCPGAYSSGQRPCSSK